MTWIKDWLRAKVRDDKKHAELDLREQRTDEQVQGLREERLKNGFGQMFGDAGLGGPQPRGRHS
jgi:hypothetical protein